MRPFPSSVILAAAIATLAGCVVYDPYYHTPVTTYNTPATYERSWNAAVGAMRDMGVQVTREDRGAGTVEGNRGGVAVSTRVVTQQDGRVRVETNTSDAGLADGLSRAYDARMGR
jgi:hypothetical protein